MADGYISQIKLPNEETYDFQDRNLKVYTGSCSTAAGTAIKDVVTDGIFTLEKGAVLFVNFTNTNSAAVGNLKLKINGEADTSAKPIKYLVNGNDPANIPGAGYLRANQTYMFRYDGTNWVADLNYYTYSNDFANKIGHYNNILARKAIAAESLIVGDETGYEKVASGVTFNLAYPIVWCTSAINANASNYANMFLQHYDRNIATGAKSGFTSAANKVIYLIVTISGNIATIDSNIITDTLPSSDDGKVYISLGKLGAQSTGANYFFLYPVHPMFWYKNGAIGEYSGASQYALAAPLSGISGADDLKAIEAISGTTGLLKKTAANTWTLDTSSYVTSSGITSITIGATSPVQSSTSTAQNGSSASTTISLKDAYGDTKNPYEAKAKNLVLAGPASGSNAAPSFRALVAADIPSLAYVPATGGVNDVNTLVNTGVYNITSGSATNAPKGYGFGQLLVMSYRKHTGNTTTDWASQIYLHNGVGTETGNATGPGNVLYYRTSNTSSSNSWFSWQKAVHVDDAYTKVGDTNKPVYIAADGTATPISYTIAKSVPSDAVFTDTNKYHKTGSWGGTNNLTYTATAVNSADALAFTLATASTSAYGATKLYSGVDSNSEVLAATSKAVKIAYDQATTALNTANNLLATADALVFKGTLGTGGTITAVPSSDYSAGWTYKVITDGTYAGIVCEAGDLLIATTDATNGQTAINNAHWTVVQENINGYIHYFNNHDNNIDSLVSTPYLQTAALSGGNWSGTKPSGSHNGVALFNFQTHSGNYYTQLALDTSQNRMWLRSADAATTFGNWAKIATVADIEALDANLNSTTPGAGKTLTAFSQTDGKVSATFGNISITKSQVSDFSHTHPWSEITSYPTLTNVSFTAATDNNEYPILIKNSTGTTTTAAGVKFPSTTGKEITINPSLGRISAAELNTTPTAYMGFNISSSNPRQSRRLIEHNTNSYRHWIILLLPYQTVTNTSINNFIDGNIYLKKSGSNIYDKVYISANLCYNALQYVLNTVSGTFTPISCTYNGVKYFALKCYDHDNPWTEIWFDGYCISSYPGGNNTTTKPLTLPYMVNYKGNGSSSGSQTVVNTEVNNSISTTLTDSIVTSVTRHNWTMDINGSATKDGSGNTITNKYFQIYNTSYQGNSSSVTVNDLASQGPAYGMINNKTDNPIGSATWVHVLNMGWAKSNSSWIGQIALHTDGSTMYFRGNSSSAIAGKAWNTVLSSNNYENYAAKTTGSNATGTWPINISGTVSWANTGHPDTFPPSAHTHNESNITWSNGTLYPIGDDIYIGDINQAGHLGLKSHQAGNTGLAFIKQATADDTTTSIPANTSMGKITWDGTKFSITSTTAVDASISGNAATATSATRVSANNTISTKSGLQYAVGQLTIGSADGNAKVGSNGSAALWSYPTGGTSTTSTVANIQNLRLYWGSDGKYFRDIFISPNNSTIYHRAVSNGTAGDWLTILDSGNTYAANANGSDVTVTCGTSATLATINGIAVKIKVTKPTYTYSDVGAAPSFTVSCTTTNVKSALGTDTSTTNKWLNQKGEWSTPTAAQVGAAPSSTVSCTAANIESALGIDFITNTGALNTNGWKTLGGRSNGAKIAVSYNNSAATWNSATYSASLVFGCSDTKGLLDIGYNSPTVVFGGGNVNGSTDNDPKWYFKLSGTSGKTYTFPSDSKTLAAADGSNASGTWSISIPWANTNHPDTFPPTIGTTSTTAMAGNTTVNQVKQSATALQNKWRKVILSYGEYAASDTAVGDAVTNVTYMAQDVAVQPYTGAMRANSYKVTDNVTLQWNSTDSSLDFVFA